MSQGGGGFGGGQAPPQQPQYGMPQAPQYGMPQPDMSMGFARTPQAPSFYNPFSGYYGANQQYGSGGGGFASQGGGFGQPYGGFGGGFGGFGGFNQLLGGLGQLFGSGFGQQMNNFQQQFQPQPYQQSFLSNPNQLPAMPSQPAGNTYAQKFLRVPEPMISPARAEPAPYGVFEPYVVPEVPIGVGPSRDQFSFSQVTQPTMIEPTQARPEMAQQYNPNVYDSRADALRQAQQQFQQREANTTDYKRLMDRQKMASMPRPPNTPSMSGGFGLNPLPINAPSDLEIANSLGYKDPSSGITDMRARMPHEYEAMHAAQNAKAKEYLNSIGYGQAGFDSSKYEVKRQPSAPVNISGISSGLRGLFG
jgi:hypothetical protein